MSRLGLPAAPERRTIWAHGTHPSAGSLDKYLIGRAVWPEQATLLSAVSPPPSFARSGGRHRAVCPRQR